MRFVRSLWDKELRGFAVFDALFSLVVVGLGLATGTAAASWLPIPLGLLGGLFSVCAAFRLFGWGRSTGRIIWATTAVAVVVMWFGQGLVVGADFPSSPPTLAGFVYRTAWLFLIGFGAPAPAVARQWLGQPRRLGQAP